MKRGLFLLLLVLPLTEVSVSAQNQAGLARAEVARRDSLDGSLAAALPLPAASTLGNDQEIYLLQESDPFFIRSATIPAWTSNAFYDFTELDDWYIDQALGLGVQTIIDERYFFLAEIGGSLTRYDQYDMLNREMLGALVSVSAAVNERTSIGVSYTSNWYFGNQFDTNETNFQNISVNTNWIRPFADGSTLQLASSLTRVEASPDVYDQTAIGAFGMLIIPLGGKTSFGITGRVDYSWFDHYFETLFDQDRQDLYLSAGIFLSFQPWKNVEIRPEINFTDANSTLSTNNLFTEENIDLYDYQTWVAFPALRISIEF